MDNYKENIKRHYKNISTPESKSIRIEQRNMVYEIYKKYLSQNKLEKLDFAMEIIAEKIPFSEEEETNEFFYDLYRLILCNYDIVYAKFIEDEIETASLL